MSDWLESRSPAFIAAGIGMLAGVCLFGYGLYGLFASATTPAPLGIALVLGGALEWLFCFLAVRRNRAGWSFAVASNAVATTLFLFGAPKVRDAFETNLGIGLLPCVAFLTVTLLLSFSAHEYRDR
jgi:hypothetical protein